ncbi:serine hydrolase domain-containing protein [Plantactinospora sp. GCM10030261]|uniref:serine hydrolase domain-containing protein n=1 Tax=Plantactinospora sp. GCM10030261 TaxID=3273420 RepID=UPI00361726BD
MRISGGQLSGATDILERATQEGRILGAHLYVSYRNEVIAHVGFGNVVPGQPAQAGDVCEMLCATKPLITVSVARAVETGLVGLDDTMARWAPAGTAPKVAAISLRELLTHSSRLPNHLGPRVYDLTFDDYIAAVLKPEFPDGFWEAHPVYNIAQGWHLLGWVLQQTYSRPLTDVVWEMVLQPLGLSRTLLVDTDQVAKPFHRRSIEGGWVAVRDSAESARANRLNPAYGGSSTIGDLGRLYNHLGRCLAHDGILRTRTMRQLITDHGGVRFWHGDETRPFGLGFYLSGGGGGLGSAWDPGSFGHPGTIASRCVVSAVCDPASNTVVVLRVSNVGTANNALFDKVGRAIRADLRLPIADPARV